MDQGRLIGERFVIEGLAQTGGMGSIYRARDVVTQERVALKLLRGGGPVHLERFQREARALAEMRHPAVVRYIAHGAPAGAEPYLVMEWLEGENLGKRLKRGRLSIAESLGLVRRVAEALSEAHVRGIIHRDIKPANLFLPNGDLAQVKLLDFGIARLGIATNSTRSGMLLGTPGYMAPEQARGSRELDARVDVFALGCVLYKCLAGKSPFQGEHLMAVLAKVLLADPPPLSEQRPVPAALEALLRQMLAKDPEGRPRNGARLIAAMDAVGPLELRDEAALVGQAPVPIHTPPTPVSAVSLVAHQRTLVSEDRTSERSGAQQSIPPPLAAPPRPVVGLSQHVAVVLAASAGDAPERPDVPTVTLSSPETAAEGAGLHALAARFGARLERLAGGSVVAVTVGESAVDQAVSAARFAIALRDALPEAPMALVLRGQTGADRLPMTEAIDRAVRLLSSAMRPVEQVPRTSAALRPIRIDDGTAVLLGARFDVADEGSLLLLRGER